MNRAEDRHNEQLAIDATQRRRQDVGDRIASLLHLATRTTLHNAISVTLTIKAGEGGEGLNAEASFII